MATPSIHEGKVHSRSDPLEADIEMVGEQSMKEGPWDNQRMGGFRGNRTGVWDCCFRNAHSSMNKTDDLYAEAEWLPKGVFEASYPTLIKVTYQ